MRNGTVKLAIEVDIGVEQIKLHAAHIDTPDVGIDYSARIRHFKDELLPALVEHRLKGKTVEVLCLIFGHLVTVTRYRLSKIAVAVKETNGSEVIAAVAGLFDVVTSQDAKSA